jgi:ATP-dependent Clp protease adaptor protein ClpS
VSESIVTQPDTHEETTTRRLPPYHVVLHNDDYHSMEFVVDVLRKVFAFELLKAIEVMMTAHEKGRAIAWTGSKEVAELKAEQLMTFHERKGTKDFGPLGVTIEPAA